jgi:hypothetical protein
MLVHPFSAPERAFLVGFGLMTEQVFDRLHHFFCV